MGLRNVGVWNVAAVARPNRFGKCPHRVADDKDGTDDFALDREVGCRALVMSLIGKKFTSPAHHIT